MALFPERRARKILDEGAAGADPQSLEETLNKRERILDKVLSNASLAPYLSQVKLLLQLVQDYAKGNYRGIPWWSLGAIVTALGYILMPLDSIPDVIPIAGYLDDAVVLKLCLDMISKDLQHYRIAKQQQNGASRGSAEQSPEDKKPLS